MNSDSHGVADSKPKELTRLSVIDIDLDKIISSAIISIIAVVEFKVRRTFRF